jgi:heme exporter protein C
VIWRATGLSGLLLLTVATGLIFTRASRLFYGVDHPINLIFYYHVSVAWVGFAGLAVAALASAAFLLRGSLRWNRLAEAAVRVSFLFLTLTLASGMVWGRFIWNSWWEWSDIRLVTALMVWFIYAGYLVLYRQSACEGDYRKGAVFCLVAFVSVPLTVAATRIWQSPFHGVTLGRSSVTIHWQAFALALAGMTLLYSYMVYRRWAREVRPRGRFATGAGR